MKFIAIIAILALVSCGPMAGIAGFNPRSYIYFPDVKIYDLIKERLTFEVDENISVPGFEVNFLKKPTVQINLRNVKVTTRVSKNTMLYNSVAVYWEGHFFFEGFKGSFFKDTFDAKFVVLSSFITHIDLKESGGGYTDLKPNVMISDVDVNFEKTCNLMFEKIKNNLTKNIQEAVKNNINNRVEDFIFKHVSSFPGQGQVKLNENASISVFLIENRFWKEGRGAFVFSTGEVTYRGIKSPLKPDSEVVPCTEFRSLTLSKFIGNSWKYLLTHGDTSITAFKAIEEIDFSVAELEGIFTKESLSDADLSKKFEIVVTNLDFSWSLKRNSKIKFEEWKSELTVKIPKKDGSIASIGGNKVSFNLDLDLKLTKNCIFSTYSGSELTNIYGDNEIQDKDKFESLTQRYFSPLIKMAFKDAIQMDIPFFELFDFYQPETLIIDEESQQITFLSASYKEKRKSAFLPII